MNLSIQTKDNIKNKVNILQKLGAGSVLDNSLDKIIELQLFKYKKCIQDVEEEVKISENR